MIKTTSKRQAQRERATETRTGFFFCSSQRCVCFNKFIIWTICFYFYFHLTVFWYFYLCGFYVMAKEFIIHRILYELWSWWRFYGNGDFSSVFASFFFSSSLSQHFLNHIFFCSFVVGWLSSPHRHQLLGNVRRKLPEIFKCISSLPSSLAKLFSKTRKDNFFSGKGEKSFSFVFEF